MKWEVYKQMKSRVLKKKGNVDIVGLSIASKALMEKGSV